MPHGRHRLDARVSRSRGTALIAVLSLIGVLTVAAQFAPVAGAAGSGTVTLTEDAPASLLYGDTAGVTLTATNPSATPEYNIAFTEVLPAGVNYVTGSTSPSDVDEPIVLANRPGTGQTTLIWNNVADLQPHANASLSFRVAPSVSESPTNPYLPGGTYTDAATVYVQTNARTLVKFDPTTGAVLAGSYTDLATASKLVAISPLKVTKTDDQPESELPRGVHDHKATYTLTVTNSAVNPTNTVTVDDYLPAALEFLGCGGVDHTTNAPTNPGASPAVEYPGAARLTAGATLASGCPVPTTVETITLLSSGSVVDGAPAQPITTCTLPSTGCAVYTHVVWTLGNLAASQQVTIKYLAAVPLKANTTSWSGATPTLGGNQGSNLDNNSGAETHDAESITNLGVASGSYTGLVKGGGAGGTPVFAAGSDTIQAIDLAVQKSVDDGAFAVGKVHRWTLNYQTGEYRSASAVVLTDTLPVGLCPIDGLQNYVDPAIEPGSDTRCNARTGVDPTIAYTSVTEQPDTSFVLAWNLSALAKNIAATLKFSSVDRGIYPAADPVGSGDTTTNKVRIDGTATAVSGVPGETAPETPTNGSAASETTTGSVISKHVADRPAVHALSPTAPACSGATYSDAAAPIYVKGDIVCFRLDVTFPSGTETYDPIVTDILPANVDYVANSATPDATNTVGVAGVSTDSDGDVVFTLKDGTTHSGRRYVNSGAAFHYYIAVKVNADPSVGSTADITANLLKLTSSDSSGRAISRRSKANYTVGEPLLHLVTGVQNITDAGITDADRGANVDGVQVKDSDIATVRVDLTNDGTTPAASASVTATVPPQITACSQVTDISNGGTCALVAGKPVITWTGLPTIAAGAGLKLTYGLAVPATAAAGAVLTSTASITGYRAQTDVVGGADDTYVPGAGGVASTGTSDPTNVFLAAATATKVAHTSMTETGNTDAQATVGEVITYTLKQTVPAGTTVFGGSFTDGFGTNQVYVPSSATVTVSPGPATGYSVAVAANTVTTTYPNQVSAGASTDTVVTVTFQVVVADIAANKTGASITNQASLAFKDAAGTAQTAVKTNQTTITVVEPKVSVTKNDGQLPAHVAAPGSTVAYTVKVTDASTANVSTAHNVVVVDTLPPGMGAPTAISDSGTYTGSGTVSDPYVLTWTLATLLANNTAKSLTYSSTVPNPVTGRQPFTNSVTVTAAGLDPVASPGARKTYTATATDTVTVSGPTITKSASPAAVTVGDDTTYTATVTVLPGMALPDFTAVDTLPDGMTFDGYVSATCSMTPAGPCAGFVGTGLPTPTKAGDGTTKLAWFLGDFADEATATRTIVLTYRAYAAETNHLGGKPADQSTLLNSINTSWNQTNGPDPTTIAGLPTFPLSGEKPATAPVTVNLPKITVAKSATPSTPKVGDTVGYTVTLGNTGHSPAYDLTVTDTLPVGLSAPTSISGNGSYDAGTRTITWTLAGPVAVNPSPAPTFTFNVKVDALNATTGAAINNIAKVTTYWGDPSGSTLDQSRYPVYGPAQGNVSITPIFPQLVIAKTVAGGGESAPAQVGQKFTWNLLVSDSTSAPANSVTVTDTLPAGWTYTPGVNATTVDGVSAADPSITGSVLTFTLPGTLVQGTPVTISYTATPTSGAVLAPGAGVNTAFASGNDADGNDHNASGPYRSASDTAQAIVASADLVLTKSLNGSLVPGQANSWTFSVHNNGLSTALGPIAVTDTLPVGASAVSAAGSGWTCGSYDAGTRTITCTRAATLVSTGTDSNLVVTATLPASTTGSVTNSGVVSSPTYDPVPANNTGSVTSSVTGVADLSITKRHVGSFTAGSDGSYTIAVHNAGPSDAQSPVSVVDQLPVGETFLTGTDPGGHWTCSADAGQLVTCTLDALLASGADAPDLTLNVHVGSAVTAALTNTAVVASPTSDPRPSNNSSTDTTTPSVQDDLAIDKSHAGDFTAGGRGDYTITVTNNGRSDEPGPIVVTDTLPTGETVFATSAGWTCVSAAAVLTCTHAGGLAAHGTPLTLTLTVAVGPSVADGATLINKATVKGAVTDTDPTNDSDTDPTTVVRSADLTLAKAVDAPIVPGQPASWTFTVHNAGPSDAAGPLTVVDTLPVGATDPGLSPASAAAGWSCTLSGARTFTCSRSAGLGVNLDDATLDVIATLPSATTADVINSGVVSSPTTDPAPANNAASVTGTPAPKADLAVTKTHTGTFVAGGQGTFTITVDNRGPSDEAGPITVTDDLPAGLTFASGPSAGWTCTPNGDKSQVVCVHAGGLTATADPLSFDITVAVAATVPDATTLTNHASVKGTTPDVDPTNDVTTDDVTIAATDDLTIAKTHSGDFTAGLGGTYTLTVSNDGPSDEIGPIVVVDALPDGETFHAASGSGWVVTHDDAAGTVTFTRAAGLGTGLSAPGITLEVDVASSAVGSLVNRATVSGRTHDTDLTNNAVTDPTTIDTTAALAIAKSHRGNFTAGGQGTYTVDVTNAGPSDEAGPIVVTDTLPDGETYAGASGSGWACTPNGDATVAVCTHAAGLAAGAPALVLQLTVDVAETVTDGSVLTNHAAVTGRTDTGTHTTTDPTTIEAHDDLTITKSHSGRFVAGTTGSYLLDVTNNGPSTEAGPITVTDTLPDGETFVSASGNGWTCTGAAGSPTVTCTSTATVAALHGPPSVKIVVAVDPAITGTLVNRAKVSGTTDDTDPDNNATTDPTGIDTSADLVITKSHSGTFTAGADGKFTLQVDNRGPSDATGVVVTDRLPSDETFVSATGAGWSCDHAGGTVTCTADATLAAEDTAAPITVTVTLASDVLPGQAKDNTATVASDVDDPDPNSNSSTDNPGSVDTEADLSIVKDSGDDHFVAGENGTYRLSVHNAGASDAAGPIVVTDALPTGETFVSATGSGWSCDTADGTITCAHAGKLAAGSDAGVITVTVAVSASFLGATLSNTASVVSGTPDNPGTHDPQTENNSSTKDEPVHTATDLKIVKAHDDAERFTPGTDGTYTLHISNGGPSDAQSVRVSDPLPAGETLVSATGDDGAGATWDCAASSTTRLDCSLTGAFPAGADSTITVLVAVDAGLLTGPLVNVATISTSTSGSDPDNLSSTDTVASVTPEADLAVAKSHTDTLVPGRPISYALTVTNHGPSDETGTITVTDTLPVGESFVSATGTGWTCAASGRTITCTSDDTTLLAPHDALPGITVVAAVDSSVADGRVLTNHAAVAGTTHDPEPANDATDDPATAVAVADLRIQKSHAAPLIAGREATYELAVDNLGPSDAAGPLTVSDTLPDGETFVSATGVDWTCAANDGVVTCSLPAGLGTGQAAGAIALVVLVGGAAYPTVTNTATVSGPTSDREPANNSSSDPATVAPASNLVITKSHTAKAYANGTLDYTVSVTNSGITADPGPVTVHDTLPAGESFVAAAGTDWACSHSGGDVTCVHATALGVGESAGFTLTVRTLAAAVPEVTNVATVTSDADTTNGSVSDPTRVLPVADLALAKRLIGGALYIGRHATYEITVTNHGPSATAGPVTITDPLPSALGFVAASGAGWTCGSAGQLVSCTRTAPIPDGASSSVHVVVLVRSGSGTIRNGAAVASVTVQTADPTAPKSGEHGDTASVSSAVEAASQAPGGSPAPGGSGGGAADTGAPVAQLLGIGLACLLIGLGLAVGIRRRYPAGG